jgi:type II secretory pathway pseudopilin PulG
MKQIRLVTAESGFTLIEALISMIILIFGLIAVTNLFVVASSSNQIALYNTVAAAEATRVLERLKTVPFNNLPTAGLSPATATHDAANPWNTANWTTASDFGAVNGTGEVFVGGVVVFNATQNVPGVGNVITRWKIVNPGAGGAQTRYFLVRSEVQALFGRGAVAQFTTFRACVAQGCP